MPVEKKVGGDFLNNDILYCRTHGLMSSGAPGTETTGPRMVGTVLGAVFSSNKVTATELPPHVLVPHEEVA